MSEGSPRRRLAHARKLLWAFLCIFIFLYLWLGASDLGAGKAVLSLDDFRRYAVAVKLVKENDWTFGVFWPHLPMLVNAGYLQVVSGRLPLADFELLVLLNWSLHLGTIVVLLSALQPGRLRRPTLPNLTSATLFAALPFVHTLGLSTLSEPLQYVIIATFVFATAHAWQTGRAGWRVLAVVTAVAWTASRYEGWAVVFALYGIGGVLAWRTKRWRYPFAEWPILAAYPAIWLWFNARFQGGATAFYAETELIALKDPLLALPLLVPALLKNTWALLLGCLLAVIVLRKHHRLTLLLALHMPATALFTAILLTCFLMATYLAGLLGTILPERFPIQVCLALCPVAGWGISRAIRALQWGTQCLVICLTGAVAGVLLWRAPATTYVPLHHDHRVAAETAAAEGGPVLYVRPYHLTHFLTTPFSIDYFSSYRQVEWRVLTNESSMHVDGLDESFRAVVVYREGLHLDPPPSAEWARIDSGPFIVLLRRSSARSLP